MPLGSSEHVGHAQETLPVLQARVKGRAWRAVFSDLGYWRRRETNVKAMWVTNQEG